MKLMIKQRVFSLTDTYDVYDESETPKYFVKSQFLSIGHNIRVYDRNNNEVGAIHQKLLTFLPKFEIEINGTTVGTIQKELSFFKPKYDIDCNGWKVNGDLFGWDYEVYSGSAAVVHISKEPFHWGDTYMLDFYNPEDEIMGLLLVIAIDAANCSDGKNK